jgi:hypothetical protein
MILEDLHTLLPNTDEYTDPILTIYKNRAITFIKNYLNSNYDSAYIEANFQEAIILLVCNTCSGKGKENIQSESQGSRSKTYKTVTLLMSDDIKALLPLPRLRLMG